MEKKKILIKYYNPKLFITVDIQTLFEIIFKDIGENIYIEVEEMNENEKRIASEEQEKDLCIIKDRFWLLLNRTERLTDIEKKIIKLGHK